MNKTHTIITIIIAVSLFSVVLVIAQPQIADINWLRVIADNLGDIGDILDKECEFEKKNQRIAILHSNENRDGGFVVPFDTGYSEVVFTRIGAIASVQLPNASLFLNEVECGLLIPVDPGSPTSPRLYNIDGCLSELHEGINSFSTESDNFRSIKEFLIEMDVKPANC